MRKLLRITAAAPIIVLERTSYLADGTPIEYTRYCAHANIYEFSLKISNRMDLPVTLATRSAPADHA
jgi:hypothetical protein